jgi:hypothetical protein
MIVGKVANGGVAMEVLKKYWCWCFCIGSTQMAISQSKN